MSLPLAILAVAALAAACSQHEETPPSAASPSPLPSAARPPPAPEPPDPSKARWLRLELQNQGVYWSRLDQGCFFNFRGREEAICNILGEHSFVCASPGERIPLEYRFRRPGNVLDPARQYKAYEAQLDKASICCYFLA